MHVLPNAEGMSSKGAPEHRARRRERERRRRAEHGGRATRSAGGRAVGTACCGRPGETCGGDHLRLVPRPDHPAAPWSDPHVVLGHLPAPHSGADASRRRWTPTDTCGLRGRPHPGRHGPPDVRSTRRSCGPCADRATLAGR